MSQNQWIEKIEVYCLLTQTYVGVLRQQVTFHMEIWGPPFILGLCTPLLSCHSEPWNPHPARDEEGSTECTPGYSGLWPERWHSVLVHITLPRCSHMTTCCQETEKRSPSPELGSDFPVTPLYFGRRICGGRLVICHISFFYGKFLSDLDTRTLIFSDHNSNKYPVISACLLHTDHYHQGWGFPSSTWMSVLNS